jgi:hypothetical protein
VISPQSASPTINTRCHRDGGCLTMMRPIPSRAAGGNSHKSFAVFSTLRNRFVNPVTGLRGFGLFERANSLRSNPAGACATDGSMSAEFFIGNAFLILGSLALRV